MQERIKIFKESKFYKQSNGGYGWIVKLVDDLWVENETCKREKSDLKQALDVAVNALEFYAACHPENFITREKRAYETLYTYHISKLQDAARMALSVIKGK